ncbi:MAG: hypothetical protein ACR2J8_10195, partial [Thermomicrobiales bacterium]
MNNAILSRIAVLAATLLALVLSTVSVALASLDPAARESVFPATVQVGVLLEGNSGERTWVTIGSGSVVSPQGLILTNH